MTLNKDIERIEILVEQDMLNEVKRLSNLGIWKLNLINNILTWSSEIYEMFEIDPLLFGASYEAFVEVIHPDDREKVNNAYKQSLRTRKPYSIEHRLLMPDDRIKYVVEACRTYYNQQGDPLLSFGVVQDITDRRINEINLYESEQRLSMLLKQTPSLIWTTNTQLEINSLFDNLLSTISEPTSSNSIKFKDLFGDSTDDIIDAHIRCISGHSSTIEFKSNNQFFHASLEPEKNKNGEIIGCIGIAMDITDRKKQEEINWQKANFDSLTGLPNRSLFQDRLQQAINQTSRRDEHFGLFFIDLDGFKNVNDTHGHDAGDDILIQVANRLRDSSRKSDTVARLSGDEFVVITQSTKSIDSIIEHADLLITKLSKPYTIENIQYNKLSASIGISHFPDHAKDMADLIRFADLAMYQAKHNGKNASVLFDQSLLNKNDKFSASNLQNSLKDAMLNNEFILYLQPRYNIKTNTITGAEALLRWNRHNSELLLPVRFLSELESSGLIHDVGAWVFDQACQFVSDWKKLGYHDLVIAINVSCSQISDPSFVQTLKDKIHKHHISPDNISLEISDDILFNLQSNDCNNLILLKDLGIHLTIDDLGTSNLSLNDIIKLSITKLKIHPTLINEIIHDASHSSTAYAIAALGKGLKYETIAQGIETEEQYNVIKQLGCDSAQGYFFEKPISSSDFKKKLQT